MFARRESNRNELILYADFSINSNVFNFVDNILQYILEIEKIQFFLNWSLSVFQNGYPGNHKSYRVG